MKAWPFVLLSLPFAVGQHATQSDANLNMVPDRNSWHSANPAYLQATADLQRLAEYNRGVDLQKFRFCEIPPPHAGVRLPNLPSFVPPRYPQWEPSFLRWPTGQPAAQPRDNTIGAPTLSIAFTTLRPGGYDILLESLALQTSKDFELICIDTLADKRTHLIQEYARKLGLEKQLVIVRGDKKKTKVHNCKFGFANGINTGALLARGKIFCGLTDFTWLADNFVERTIEHFKLHPNTLLAHQQAYYFFPDSILNHTSLHDPEALTTFNPPITTDPRHLPGWEIKKDPYTPLPVPEGAYAMYSGQYYWDGTALTIDMELFEKLNGFDELMDSGKESHNMDVADRAVWMFGATVWVDGGTFLVNIAHHEVKTDDEFYNPPAGMIFSNVYRWVSDLLPKVKSGQYPAKARNWFDLADVRRTRDPTRPLEESLARYDPQGTEPSVKLVYPETDTILYDRQVKMRVETTNFVAGSDGMVCYVVVPKGIAETKPQCISHTNEFYTYVPPGVWYLRVFLTSLDGIMLPYGDYVVSMEIRDSPDEDHSRPPAFRDLEEVKAEMKAKGIDAHHGYWREGDPKGIQT